MHGRVYYSDNLYEPFQFEVDDIRYQYNRCFEFAKIGNTRAGTNDYVLITSDRKFVRLTVCNEEEKRESGFNLKGWYSAYVVTEEKARKYKESWAILLPQPREPSEEYMRMNTAETTPIEEAFARLTGVLDRPDPTKFMAEIAAHFETMETMARDTVEAKTVAHLKTKVHAHLEAIGKLPPAAVEALRVEGLKACQLLTIAIEERRRGDRPAGLRT